MVALFHSILLFTTFTLTPAQTLLNTYHFPSAQYEIIYPFNGDEGQLRSFPRPIRVHEKIAVKTELPPRILQGAGYSIPVSPAVGLFTPNTVQQPAETRGQIENYYKALEEEAREADKAANQLDADPALFGAGVQSYVNVRLHGAGDKQYNYGYFV